MQSRPRTCHMSQARRHWGCTCTGLLVLLICSLIIHICQAQMTDITDTELELDKQLTNFYVVELKDVGVGRNYFNVSWTDLNKVHAMGKLYVQLGAGAYHTLDKFVWVNDTSVYNAGNFSDYGKITGLRPSTWYKLCYKATHIIGQYGIESAICIYKKTLDESDQEDSALFTYTKAVTNDQIGVDVRILYTPFNISAVGVYLNRVPAKFPITTQQVLIQDSGYHQTYSFTSLLSSTVYQVCVWAENNRLSYDTYSNDTDCTHAYTNIPAGPGAGPTPELSSFPVRNSGGDSTGGAGIQSQDVSGGAKDDAEEVNVAGVGGVRQPGSTGRLIAAGWSLIGLGLLLTLTITVEF